MNHKTLFGTRLYTRLIMPLLLLIAALMGLFAVAANHYLDVTTGSWLARVGQESTAALVSHQLQLAEGLSDSTRAASASTTVADALASQDKQEASLKLDEVRTAFDFDLTAVVDDTGLVHASSDPDRVAAGMPLIEIPRTVESVRADFDTIWGTPAVVSVSPIPGDREMSLVTARYIDGQAMQRFDVEPDGGYALYGRDFAPLGVRLGRDVADPVASELEAMLSGPSPEVRGLLAQGATGFRREFADVEGIRYMLWCAPVVLPGASEVSGYAVNAMSLQEEFDAARDAGNVLGLWSLFVVLSLALVGGVVARRVTEPLVDLSRSARLIATGDFDTRVAVSGDDEVTDLAKSFNTMTDSVRERSETLTKKVLELATLYEMSRSLSSTLDIDELLDSAMDSVLRIFDLELGYVALREPETGDLRVRALHGAPDASEVGTVRSSMSEWVVREGRPLIFNPDQSMGAAKMDAITGARAALCVPLISSQETIGAITIGSKDPDYRFSSEDVRLLSTIANHVTMAIGSIELFTSLQQAYLATVRSLAMAVDAKDSFTRGHSDHVAYYASLIAERMGLSHEQRVALEMAAYLHDIGKIGIKEGILFKEGRLDEDEMTQMRHHPLIGANILRPVEFPWAITPIVRHHHEKHDGTGYPAGLRGDEIPILARILSVADSFEAMTADRPYREAVSIEDAVEELRRCSGTQFDPAVVDVMIELIEDLEKQGESIITLPETEIVPSEARAVFAALVQGLFASFTRLGGMRLAVNVEDEVSSWMEAERIPFSIVQGQIVFQAPVPEVLDEEADQMRDALGRIDAIMGRLSGSALVDHFYAEAIEDFSANMRDIVSRLGLMGDH